MINITVQASTDRAIRKLSYVQMKQVPFATALALTKTGQAVKAAITETIPTVFQAPTQFTVNSIFLTPATKSRLWAKVWIKDRQAKYLFPEVEGGYRNSKGFENLLRRNGMLPAGWFAIPTASAPRNGNGNVPGSVLVKVLSQLQASRETAYNENTVAKRKRNAKASKGRYFAILPGRSHLPAGIYERMGTAFGSGVKMIFVYTPKKPVYRKRLPFYERAASVTKKIFPLAFREALRVALATERAS